MRGETLGRSVARGRKTKAAAAVFDRRVNPTRNKNAHKETFKVSKVAAAQEAAARQTERDRSQVSVSTSSGPRLMNKRTTGLDHNDLLLWVQIN